MAANPRDIVDIDGFREDPSDEQARNTKNANSSGKRKFLSVHFTCCNTYGRLYPDAARTRYQGRCPRCGATVEAKIGPSGTDRRMFDTQ